MTKETGKSSWYLVLVGCARCGHLAVIWLPWKDLRYIQCGECEAKSWNVISWMEDEHGND